MKKSGIAVLLVLISGIMGFYLQGLSSSVPGPEKDGNGGAGNCIPAFRDGGGPYYRPGSPFRSQLAPPGAAGVRLAVKGRILEKDCRTPVAAAVLDVWQADGSGNYLDDWYRGQVRSGRDGSYSFETVIPGGYGEGTGYRPPHIHFKVFSDGRELVTSQMFFPEVRGTPGFDDAYIMGIDALPVYGSNVRQGIHDIIIP